MDKDQLREPLEEDGHQTCKKLGERQNVILRRRNVILRDFAAVTISRHL